MKTKKLCPTCNRPLGEKTVSENARKAGSVSSDAKRRAARQNIIKRWENERRKQKPLVS